jgi:hypothetical protein
MFVANITDEFILGLDVLRARDAAVYLRRLVLRLGKQCHCRASARDHVRPL